MCSGKIKSYLRVPASYLRVPASLYKPYHSMNYRTFAYQEVKEFKEVREVKAICFTDRSSTKKAVGYNF